MTNRHEEVLSAFVDEETSAFETRLSVKEIVTDDGQRSRWERYHLIRDTLRGNVPPIVDKEFCNKIMTTIDRTVDSDPTSERAKINSYAALKPIAGLAIAASVAIVTVLSVKTLIVNAPSVNTGAVVQLDAEDQRGSRKPEVDVRRSLVASNPSEEARLNSYLVNHAEYASRRSMIPYARIVGYDVRQK